MVDIWPGRDGPDSREWGDARVVDGIWLQHEDWRDALTSGGVYSLFSIALAGVVGAGWSKAAITVRGGSAQPSPSGIMGFTYGIATGGSQPRSSRASRGRSSSV